MIKSTSKIPLRVEKTDLPCLVITRDNIILLATDISTENISGIVLSSSPPIPDLQLGKHVVYDKINASKYHGEVTLRNN